MTDPLIQHIWQPAPEAWVLPEREVQVWRVFLDAVRDSGDLVCQTLSADEQQRAARFRFDLDRQRFAIARGVLRHLLGQYLQMPPDQIQFEYGPYGKPYLAGESLQFNLSHSQGLALYGFSRDRPLGIDVEWVRPVPQLLQIAKRYFPAQDYAILQRLESDQQIRQFFEYWTRKEAHLKALGTGLSHAKPLADQGPDLDPTGGWQAKPLAPDVGAIATLVAQGQDWSLSCWDSPLT